MKHYVQTRNSNNYDLFDAFDDFFKPMFYDESKEMRTNVKEDENGYELDLELPGYQKEQIKVALENGYLTVSAKREEKDLGGKHYLRREISESCQRSFYVGENISQADIKAKFDNGILNLYIPKEQPKRIEPNYIDID